MVGFGKENDDFSSVPTGAQRSAEHLRREKTAQDKEREIPMISIFGRIAIRDHQKQDESRISQEALREEIEEIEHSMRLYGVHLDDLELSDEDRASLANLIFTAKPLTDQPTGSPETT